MLLSASWTFAQRFAYVPMKYELVVAPISGNAMRGLHLANTAPASPYSYQFTQGVRGKYRLNAWQAIRGSAMFHRELETTERNGSGDRATFNEYVRQGLDVRLGMDDMLYYQGRFQLYGGGDLVLRSLKGTSQLMGALIDTEPSKAVSYSTYGVAGFLGLRYFISKNASISVENSVLYQIAPASAQALGVARKTWQVDVANVGLSVHWHKMKKKCTCGHKPR